MDLEKIAHDITISLLPRALDRHKIHNEWQEVGDDVIAFAKDSIARDYFSIYSSVLLGLQEEEEIKSSLFTNGSYTFVGDKIVAIASAKIEFIEFID